MYKNTASQKWIVFAFDRTDNTPKTGDAANITANLRIDGAAANPVDDTNPTELEDGYYVFDITQAETNGNLIVICPASGTADIQVIGVPGAVYTSEANAILADTNELQGDWVNGGRLDLIVDAILADTAELQSDWTNGGRLDLLLDAVKAKTDNLPSSVPKAVALPDFAFVMYSSTDHVTPSTGLSVSGYISKDGGAFAALGGTITAIASGVYQVDEITAVETDADVIVLRFTATGADDVVIVIKTDS